MRRLPSMQSRFFATLLSAALVAAPLHVAYAAPTVEDLYTQGQEKFDAGAYGDAGDLWGQAVQLLPEDKTNSATRQTMMNLALDAYLRAYRSDNDRSHIDDAKALLDSYEAALEGTTVALSDEIASEKGKIEGILADIAKAEEEAAAAAAAAEAKKNKEAAAANQEPVSAGDDRPGQGLVIGGAVMLGLGAVGVGLLVGGVVASNNIQAPYNAAEPGTARRDDLRSRGYTMNAVAYTGAVVAPLMIGAGLALLIIGIRRNQDSRQAMIAPAFGPDYAGFGVSGRF